MSKTLWLDCDGVFADFNRAAYQVHGWSGTPSKWEYYLDFGMTRQQFWYRIASFGDRFYDELVEPYPWADELRCMVTELFDNVAIITDATHHPGSYASKIRWLSKNLPGIPVFTGAEKWRLARPGDILIDDYDGNTDAWVFRGGGFAALFPQPWNSGRDKITNRFYHLEKLLVTFRSAKV